MEQVINYRGYELPVEFHGEVAEVAKLLQLGTYRFDVVGEINSVNGRNLWKALKSERRFADWVKYWIETLGLQKGFDWDFFTQSVKKSKRGRPEKEYIFTLDAAKHIALASGSKIGHKIRKYFILAEQAVFDHCQLQSRELSTTLEKISQTIKEKDQRIEELRTGKLRTYSNGTMSLRKFYKTYKDRLPDGITESDLWDLLVEKGVVENIYPKVLRRMLMDESIGEQKTTHQLPTFHPDKLMELIYE